MPALSDKVKDEILKQRARDAIYALKTGRSPFGWNRADRRANASAQRRNDRAKEPGAVAWKLARRERLAAKAGKPQGLKAA